MTKITITQEISSCRECPHITNNVREHDDPFTSTPLLNSWWCTKKNGPRGLSSKDVNEVSAKCPLLPAKKEAQPPATNNAEDLQILRKLIKEGGLTRWYPGEVIDLITTHKLKVAKFTRKLVKEGRYLWYKDELYDLIDKELLRC